MPPKQFTTSPTILTIRSRVAQEAHFIINEILPAKIVSLQQSSSFNMYDNNQAKVNETSANTVPKKHKRTEDMAPTRICNEKEIGDIHTQLRNEISELVGYCVKIRLWATLLMPRFNNENRLNEPIEDVISELSRVENEGFAFLDSIVQYYNTRARLVKKCMKYKSVQEHSRAIEALDAHHLISIRQQKSEIWITYYILYDMMSKHWKILQEQ